ncbi:MAG: alpha/beta fold hydrolase [Luteimonas sp.]|nr:alpha/beta fold hydrolase [Luteimonas sp.]
MPTKKLTFPNAAGQQLAARLDLPPDDAPSAYALFAHCFTCSKNLTAITNISRALTRAGIGVLRFDFTGLGESEGDFADTNFSSNVGDLVEAAAFLAREYAAPQLLIGHSLGGAAVLHAAARLPDVTAVVTIGAPCDPAHVRKLLVDADAAIATEGRAAVTLAGRTFTITQQFLDDLDTARMRATIQHLGKALLICHAPFDTVVGIENAAHIFAEARHPKSFLSLDQADHLLSNPRDSRYVGATIAAWASRYVTQAVEEQPSDESDGRVVVRTARGGFFTEIAANGHHLGADEPTSAGGTNQGPTPYDLLAAALGACTTITVQLYADRKGWPLEYAVARLRHQKIHAADCEECETKNGKIDQIERELEFIGPLDAAQRQRLREIADKCPVHRTLHSEIEIRTTHKG